MSASKSGKKSAVNSELSNHDNTYLSLVHNIMCYALHRKCNADCMMESTKFPGIERIL